MISHWRSLLLALLVPCFLSTAVTAAPKPNIIYILADDLGIGDLGAYGQKMLTTPHLDRMAAEGMKFTRHYAGCTVCAPSRCVLMTGMHTGHCAVRGNGPGLIPDDTITVPKLLKQAGYHTACIGKYGLGKPLPLDDSARKGFDYFYGYLGTSHAHNFYTTALVRNGKFEQLPNTLIPDSGKDAQDYANTEFVSTGVAPADGRKAWAPQLLQEDVLRYLDDRGKESGTPFFLYYALNLPHANNEAGKNGSPMGHGMEVQDYGEFATKDWPDAEKGFAQMIRFIDNQVGLIIEKLKALNLDENTIILFSSDNGPHKEGGHSPEFFDSNGISRGIKRDMTDGGIRVPLIARWPGKIKAGSVSNHVSGFQDLLPTAAELSGVSAPKCDGVSMVSALTGQGTQKEHEFLFWSFDEQGGKQAVLQWPWKLIHLQTNPGGSRPMTPKKAAAAATEPKVQLFNLESDPEEKRNVANDQPEMVAKLAGFIQQSYVAP